MLRFIKRQISFSSLVYALPKKNRLPPRPKWLIKEEELKEKFLKGGSGPGGQKINKTNSKVQLTHIPTGIVVTCQASRSQEQNRKKAREILALKLDDLYNPTTSRNAILHDRAQKVKANKMKKSKRKYKQLNEESEKAKLEEMEREKLLLQEFENDDEEEFDKFIKNAKIDI